MSYYKLKDLISEGKVNVGSSLYVAEGSSAVAYTLVNIGYGDNEDVVVLMRRYADTSVTVSFNKNASDNFAANRIYAGNTLDNYLSSTQFNKYPAAVRNAIVPVPIQVADKNGSLYYIKRTVFAPSATEIGYGPMSGCNPQEGSKFTYFDESFDSVAGNDSASRRVLREKAAGDGLEWNTRTRNCGSGTYDHYYCIGVEEDGDYEKARWQINKKYVRPFFCLNNEVTVNYNVTKSTVVGNLPPETPSVSFAPSSVMCEETFSIEWTESQNGSADIDSSIAPKYQVQYRTDDSEWIDAVTSTSLTMYTAAFNYNETEKVIYRVRAIDGYSNYSAWVLFPEIKIINNIAPETPSFINISGKYTEDALAITWGTATDSDYNLAGYKLYRSVDGGEYELVYEGENTSYTDMAGVWNTVAYKVNAYDSYDYESDFVEAEKTLEVKCTIKLSVADDSVFAGDDITLDDFAFVSDVISAEYNLTDTKEGLTYTVSLAIDGAVFLTLEDVTVGTVTFDIPFDVWQKWLNGEHIFTVTATDSEGSSASLDTAFKKLTFSLEISLAEPIVMSDEAKRFMLTVKGEFPEGVSVQVTNNANDDDVVWQELAEDEYIGEDYVSFTNENIANGFAFNFLIISSTSEGNGYLSSVSGIVGENLFEMVLTKLNDLDNRVTNLEA